MMMPSWPIWLIRGAVIILFSVLLRYLRQTKHTKVSARRLEEHRWPADP